MGVSFELINDSVQGWLTNILAELLRDLEGGHQLLQLAARRVQGSALQSCPLDLLQQPLESFALAGLLCSDNRTVKRKSGDVSWLELDQASSCVALSMMLHHMTV